MHVAYYKSINKAILKMLLFTLYLRLGNTKLLIKELKHQSIMFVGEERRKQVDREQWIGSSKKTTGFHFYKIRISLVKYFLTTKLKMNV